MKKGMLIGLLLGLGLVVQGCAGKDVRFSESRQGVLQDVRSALMWQLERGPRLDSFEEAKAYAENLKLGGYDDWRLPTIYELYDLNYLFDLHKNGEIVLDREGNYWSGEKDGEGMIGAWAISDQCDPERQYEPGKSGYVRAVRP